MSSAAAALAAATAATGTTASIPGASSPGSVTIGTGASVFYTTGVDTTANGTTVNPIVSVTNSGSWVPGPSWILWGFLLLVAVLGDA